ncbi:hypothetical protein [Oceanisphaera sp. W20_SRM_FM3]|uniref:hypothetical protein n=1 Tax=Oceanisphaera sp. W20_SRM_FM3 TaxID=3240267 RepID=UPI003F983F61
MNTDDKDVTTDLTQVRRRLRLENLNQLQIELLAKEFNEEVGVTKVVVSKHWLDIEYDVSILTLERVIALLEAYGGELSADWWTSLKTSWYQKREQKLRAQAEEEKPAVKP